MSKRPIDLRSSNGSLIRLGHVLGSGGEGTVWDIPASPSFVAKVYHSPMSADRVAKILYMVSSGTEQLHALTAWPSGLLRTSSGEAVGLLMPKLLDRKDIHNLYSPKSRRVEFQRADWRVLVRVAANTARAFAAVHQAGYVIGDVNHGSILVGQDATVKLIDCESFQVTTPNGQFLCEVGVETFTPPELQGRSFKGVVRSPNHDNFGLAVMIFLLLFMGRHPFAGRFSGQGDMPIPKAIEEFRFPYGSRASSSQMRPPPHTPPLDIVGRDLLLKFEYAFAKEMVTGRRTSAKEWVVSLQNLEKSLVQCKSNPAHWYHQSTPTCPWCPIEGATGVPLFGIVLQGSTGPTFDLTAFWTDVDAIKDPGVVPAIQGNRSNPSEVAIKIGKQQKYRLFVAILAALIIAVAAASLRIGILYLVAGVAFFAVYNGMIDKRSMKQIINRYGSAQSHWRKVEAEWQSKGSATNFYEKRAALSILKQEWLNLPSRRAAQLEQLQRDHRQLQLNLFLDQFKISKARIDSIGPSKTQTLASYGIETALDVTERALRRVPGFGPKTRQKMVIWRGSVEARFRFEPNKPIDPIDIKRIEDKSRLERMTLESKLRTGLAELRQAQAQIVASRAHMRPFVEKAHSEFLQAEADYLATR